jgi:anthranilate/para-aminobenzoate synthase component I
MLSYDPREGLLRSCPMKGTARHRDAGALRRSEKDKAELAMIVDLVRNDLGRVARPGGVRVEVARAIERHARGGARVAQATASVVARPNPGTTWLDVLRAFFPAGSVTGAPKIRAMQIIDELEAHRRGPYCGCAFVLCDNGYFAANVAIRTACVRGGVLDWWVGAGIVADSDPAKEWSETLVKAGVLRSLLARPACQRAGSSPARRRNIARSLS